MSVSRARKMKTGFQRVYPTWEQRKNISAFAKRPKNADKLGSCVPDVAGRDFRMPFSGIGVLLPDFYRL